MTAACETKPVGRRRKFWATQPAGCGTEEHCGAACGKPGLAFVENTATISTDNWIRGLVINMLMTDGRSPDSSCGFAPGGQGGHWSESYAGVKIGSLIRTISTRASVSQLAAALRAYAQDTLSRLVVYGVARKVDVDVTYTGNGVFSLAVLVYGTSYENTRVGIDIKRTGNEWVWS